VDPTDWLGCDDDDAVNEDDAEDDQRLEGDGARTIHEVQRPHLGPSKALGQSQELRLAHQEIYPLHSLPLLELSGVLIHQPHVPVLIGQVDTVFVLVGG